MVIGVVALIVAVLAFLIILGVEHHHRQRQGRWARAESERQREAEPQPVEEPTPTVVALVFGPVIERDLEARVSGSNQFLNLGSQKLLTATPEISNALATSQPTDDEGRFWEGLDIPDGSRRFQYIQLAAGETELT